MSAGVGARPGPDAPEPDTIPVLVLLCESLETFDGGLDLLDVRRWLESDGAVSVRGVVDLCSGPAELSTIAAAKGMRLVLGLCSWEYAAAKVESRIRDAGLDPLGAQIVNLGWYCARAHARAAATEKAKALLSAAVARSRAFGGTRPENVTAYFELAHKKVSRRGLFTLPPLRYRPLASIDKDRCGSENGCRLCVQVCPAAALKVFDRRVMVDKRECVACGLCVVECPATATDLASASPAQLEAEVGELLRTPALAGFTAKGIVFVCGRAASALEQAADGGGVLAPEWLPVHVPCTGMVPVHWMLGALSAGADGVLVVACEDGCPFGQRGRIESKTAYCRALLRLFGAEDQLVRLVEGADLVRALSQPPATRQRRSRSADEGPDFTASAAAARSVLCLARDYGAPHSISLAHASSPLGVVRIDATVCTGCGNCARSCPTGALSIRDDDESLYLDFDPALCNACGLCIGPCPEARNQALHVDRATDLEVLSRGRVVLFDDLNLNCDCCGAVIGPASLVRRIDALLTRRGEVPGAVATMTRRCPSCRLAPTSPQP